MVSDPVWRERKEERNEKNREPERREGKERGRRKAWKEGTQFKLLGYEEF